MNNLRPKTIQLIKEQHEYLRINNVGIFPISDNKVTIQTPSIIIRLEEDKFEINKVLYDLVPAKLHDKLLIQPPEGFHLSLDWFPAEQYNQEIANQLIPKLDTIAKNLKIFIGHLVLPIAGSHSIWAGVDIQTSNTLFPLRQVVAQAMSNLGLTSKTNPDRYDLFHVSLARYVKPLNLEEKEQLISIKPISFNVNINNLEFALTDKFANPKQSKTLKHWKFS